MKACGYPGESLADVEQCWGGDGVSEVRGGEQQGRHLQVDQLQTQRKKHKDAQLRLVSSVTLTRGQKVAGETQTYVERPAWNYHAEDVGWALFVPTVSLQQIPEKRAFFLASVFPEFCSVLQGPFNERSLSQACKRISTLVNAPILYSGPNELIIHTMSSEGKAARPLTSSTSSML